jgi:chemotaxis signal transduction protein
MTNEVHAHNPNSAPEAVGSGVGLRFALSCREWSVPLHRLHHLAGYATLTGMPEDYFLGWLAMQGERVPVFDLNRAVCDQATPEHFGSRIMVLRAAPDSPTPYIGLLAAGVTGTISRDATPVEQFDLDSYLPMLYTLIPAAPTEPSASQ